MACHSGEAAAYGGAAVIMVGVAGVAAVLGLVAGAVSDIARWPAIKAFVVTLALLSGALLVLAILAAGGDWATARVGLMVVGLVAIPAAGAAFGLGRFAAAVLRRRSAR